MGIAKRVHLRCDGEGCDRDTSLHGTEASAEAAIARAVMSLGWKWAHNRPRKGEARRKPSRLFFCPECWAKREARHGG